MHSQCHLIHTGEPLHTLVCTARLMVTDLKQDNILVGIEDPSVLEDLIRNYHDDPAPRKIVNNGSIYLSRNNFGNVKSYRALPNIADFGLAVSGKVDKLHRYPIQPPLYHAPEVIFGTGWTYSVDIWNLGVLVCHVIAIVSWLTQCRYGNCCKIVASFAISKTEKANTIAMHMSRR